MNDHSSYIDFQVFTNFPELTAVYTKRPLNFNWHNISIATLLEQELPKLKGQLTPPQRLGSQTVILYQNHTDNIAIINQENLNNKFDDYDGAITNLKNVNLLTISADCQSIFLYDPIKRVIGNIHSGWRGTSKHIVEKAINLMTTTYGSDPQNIHVAISPSIQKANFEVEQDVVDIFRNNFANQDIDNNITHDDDNSAKYHIDTVDINRKLIISLGVKPEHLYCSDICTYQNRDFHSARRDRSNAGRNAAIISQS